MKTIQLLPLVAVALGGATMAAAQEAPALTDRGPDHHIVHPAESIEWQPAPPSLESGAEVAVLEGDPSSEGVFTMRIRMPDGFTIAPHWHPNVERVTVISGVFHLGPGTTVDPDVAYRLESGGYISLPPGTEHFAIAEGETVIQLSTVGPWVLNYVDPADDPRLR